MRSRTLLAVAAVAAAMIAGISSPAAATGDETDVTFTLSPGSLGVSAAATASLGTVAAGATSVSGALGSVTVADDRGSVLGWSVTASSTTFSNALSDEASDSSEVTYSSGSFTATSGTGTFTPTGDAVSITGLGDEVATHTGAHGVNGASFNPTLTVTMPAAALATDYTGTVTTSVA